jgi:hypothetical protein
VSSYNDLKSAVNKALSASAKALEQGRFEEARHTAASATAQCKAGLNGAGQGATAKERSKTLIRGILCAACRDIADSALLMSRTRLDGKEPETIWNQLINSLERLRYVDGRMEGPLVEKLIAQANQMKDRFDERFGQGLYAKSEVFIARELCSICNDDFRRCEHLAGRLYDGVMCKRVAENPEIRSLSFVRQLSDFRGRLWPWNWDEQQKRYSTEAILASCQLDDLSDPRRPEPAESAQAIEHAPAPAEEDAIPIASDEQN